MHSKHGELLLFLFGLVAASGCASTVKQAAKEAAPAAVEGGVKEANQPDTRDRIANALSDPQVQDAVAKLSKAVAEGVLAAMLTEERVGGARDFSNAFAHELTRSFTTSLRQDLTPIVPEMLSSSVHQSLDEQTEARLEALARAVARGSAQGVSEALEARLQTSGQALGDVVRQAAREAGREMAFGVQDAIAQSTVKQRAGEGRSGDLLAAAGRTSDSVITVLRHGTIAIMLVLLLAAMIATVLVLRRHPRH